MKRNSFTLTELLAVFSIIAILLAIIFPALQNSRQKAKAIICSSNLKQLTVSMLEYEIENGTLPYSFNNDYNVPDGGFSGFKQYDRTGWWWFNFIKGYYKKSDEKNTIIKCPSKLINNPNIKNDILCGNYGVNRSICKSSDDRQSRREEFIGTPLRITDISIPAKTLLIVDSGYALINWWYVIESPPVTLRNFPIEDTAYIPGLSTNKNRTLMMGQEQDAFNGRHPNKKVNVGFVDGHVNFIQADGLIVEKTEERYKNKTPLWVPK